MLALLLLPVLPQLPAQDQFDKDAFLSRKKWYVTFTLSLKGKGESTRRDGTANQYTTRWDIFREVTGTFELNDIHDNRPRHSTLADGEKSQGRFISWDVPEGAELSPVTYIVADRVEHDSVTEGEASAETRVRGFAKFAGGGVTEFGRRKELKCDLKEMVFDFDFRGLRNWNRDKTGKPLKLTGEYHDFTPATKVRRDFDYPIGEFRIFGNLPEVDPLLAQLMARKLELREGKIVFTVSMPVEQLPEFPPHPGNNYGDRRAQFNEFTTAGGPPLELSLSVEISPTPPSRAKLILEPEDSYRTGPETWRPRCSESEEKAGNDLSIDWRVEEESGDPAHPAKVKRVVFSLLNTSKEPGVCMNHPLHPRTPADFDLKFKGVPAAAAAPVAPPGYHVAMDGQKLTLTDTLVSTGNGSIAVDCFDAGATGALVAEAWLEDGRILKGVVAETGENQLLIPDFELGVSWIARGWRAKYASDKKDDSDDEYLPQGDAQVGDGLTVWEEYRGFWTAGHWNGGCDPQKKDLFIVNCVGGDAQGGISLFAAITELGVHDTLQWEEVKADRVVNFNVGGRPHLVDQHCIMVTEGGTADGSASFCSWANGANFPGPPKNTWEVSILLSVLEEWEPEAQRRSGETYEVAYADSTVAHELGHAVGIRHHGESDTRQAWKYEKLPTGETLITSGGVPIKVYNEAGEWLIAEHIFPGWKPGEFRFVQVGERHGQMSGDEACVMRYDNALAYRSQASATDYYFVGWGNEIWGVRLCTSPAGTGVNMPTHEPQSRYFGASDGRGDCLHKFVISDRWEKIH